ncbi:MAG: NUDIX domain-containing protein [Treponema sp.]|nr:NUDIX domain-containing protein [Treponema sp.]
MSRSIACIDYRKGKLLIAKRKSGGDMGERWEFPGGKIEEGEDFTKAINREMQEEFGCKVRIFEQLAQASFVHKGKDCTVNAFRVKFENDGIKKPFVLTEHTQSQWVSPEQINNLNFVDSDLTLFPQIKKALGI